MFGIRTLKRRVEQISRESSNKQELLQYKIDYILGKDLDIVIDLGYIKIRESYTDHCIINGMRMVGTRFIKEPTVGVIACHKIFNSVKEAEEEKKNIIKSRLGL